MNNTLILTKCLKISYLFTFISFQGNIYGGIIGTEIVRYDIYGRDVLIANKMESGGVEGKIMISENTKKILEREACQNWRYTF